MKMISLTEQQLEDLKLAYFVFGFIAGCFLCTLIFGIVIYEIHHYPESHL